MSTAIEIRCPKCGKSVETPRQPHDYPEATRMVLHCAACWDGDFDEPTYYADDGAIVDYDPDLIPLREAAEGSVGKGKAQNPNLSPGTAKGEP